uniref:Pentatricopeptide repeat-containing protein At1g80270, mitochondrial-like n=1 Tax=Nelumbo nucifera TaxID=4432 RepID=A0A822Y9L3_NELNU|nr:TPA_asm: hypothetical protein HUJ06_030708 [Nelumbo nucifera]
MWALRRAVHPLRGEGYRRVVSSACAKFDIASNHEEHIVGICDSSQFTSGKSIPLEGFHQTRHLNARFSLGSSTRSLSSQAGAKSSGEEDELEDGFSELEGPSNTEEIGEDAVGEENDEELVSQPELSDDDAVESMGDASHNELDVEADICTSDTGETELRKKRGHSDLFKVIMAASRDSVRDALNKWVGKSNMVSRPEILSAMLNLRKRRMYERALQLSEWLEENKHLDFIEHDYASRLDLIAKKAEEVFNKMKDLEFPLTVFTCNQLLLLYKKLDKKKIADVLLLMEKENVKPSLFTYRILIDTKGQSNDILGMEQLLETMNAKGVEPDLQTKATIAKHYADAGLNDKADKVLKEMEGSNNLKENRGASRALLLLYAARGKSDDVMRVWKACEPNPLMEEYLAAIEAWGKLGNIKEAESVFERMIKKRKSSSKCYTCLLKVYAEHKMLGKGKELVKRMADSGCHIPPLTWDAIVKLYVEAGEVEKADSILNKAVQQRHLRPLYNSYMTIMDKYAKRGDVHNAEKIFNRLRQSGYLGRVRQYQVLLEAYINAKTPAYGFRERLKADNLFPNRALASQLVKVDAFRKIAMSDLFD